MAETVAVSCPECGKNMKIRAETLGKKIRCKGCDEVFVARDSGKTAVTSKPASKPAPKPAAKAKPAAPAAASNIVPFKEEEDEEGSNPYGITELSTSARCPECANEMESEEAIICLHCGYNTQTRIRAETKVTVDTTPGDVVVWLMPGILCVVGIILLLTGDIVFCVFIDDWVDGSDTWSWMNWFFWKFWGSIINCFIMFFLGRFAVERLIMNSTPPEIEVKGTKK